MASETELDTFIKKFKDLWKSGIGAHLDIDTHAGEAWVGLRVRLGHAPGPPHYQVQVQERARNGPSRQRRRERRAQERKQVEAEEASKAVSENETDSVEEVMELATADVVISNLNYLSSNADAEIDYSCDFCETKFSSLRAVQIHIGKKHKVTGSPIPQVDGVCDTEVAFSFVSDFHKEDIEYTLQEFIPDYVETKLVSVVRIGGLQSADQLCTLLMKMPPDRNFTWPTLSKSQSEVIKDLKTVPNFDPA
jgi:hypothetical protein